MRKMVFDGKFIKVTTESVGDRLIERVMLSESAHTFLVTDEKKIRLVIERKLGLTETKQKVQAGIIDPGETPLAAAKREVLEELGLEAGKWQPVFTLQTSGTVNDLRHYFLAKQLTQITDETDDEILGTEDYSLAALYERAMSGNFTPITQAAIARLNYLVETGQVTL